MTGHSRGLSIRLRLALWFGLLMTCSLALYGFLAYWQARRGVLEQVDRNVTLGAEQALAGVDDEGGRLRFGDKEELGGGSGQLPAGFRMQLHGMDGKQVDAVGSADALDLAWPPVVGLSTRKVGAVEWRLLTRAVRGPEQGTPGWLLVAESLAGADERLTDLRGQLLGGAPLAIILSLLGAYLLAGRALRPVDRITRTAGAIDGGNLALRIGYRGPDDEVGRLAATLDGMLQRLDGAMERERRFTADAAHELRTPLTALKGNLEVTLSRQRSPEDYAQSLAAMQRQVERLIGLSTGLLDLARIEQGRSVDQRCEVSLDACLAEAADWAQPAAGRKRVTIARGGPSDAMLRGDDDMLLRLFANLLDNAVRHSPAGATVVIDSRREGDWAVVRIKDEGPGIAPEQRQAIFERFYRVDADRSRLEDAGGGGAGGGAGLGLAIVKAIAEAHGGTVGVEGGDGDEDGAGGEGGTVFTVRLPLAGG